MANGITLGRAFLPNRVISRTTIHIIIAFQVILAIVFWWFSPWEVLPRPDEVFRAAGNLWLNQGLGRELITSITLNATALFWTLVISLLLSYMTVLPFFRPIATAVSKGRFLG